MRLAGPRAAVSGLGLIALLLLASAGTSYWNTHRVVGNQQWVTHTRQVLETINDVRATVMEAESGERGFLLTGDPSYLEGYQAAATRSLEQFRSLAELTSDNPEQEARVARLRELIDARLERLSHTVAVEREQGAEAARKIVRTDQGQLLMERIRQEAAAIEAAEKTLLARRVAESERSLRSKLTTTALTTLLGLAAVGFAFVLFQRTLEERRREERRQNALGELRQEALSDADLDRLAQRCVEIVAQVLGVPLVKVLELLPGGDAFLLRAGVGWKEGTVGRATVGAELDSQAGYTLHASRPVVRGDLTTHEPIVVEDLRTETRFRGPALLSDHGVVSGVSVIIYDRPGRPFGVLGAHTTSRRPFTDEDAGFLQAMANVLAIAIQRRRAEDALRDSEGRFRALADSVPEIVWTSDHEGRCDYLNRRWTEFTGMGPEQAGAEGWLAGLHADDRGEAARAWEHSVQTGEPFAWEGRVRSRDGSDRWCLGRALPLRDAGGRIVKWFGNWMDIDDHRRMEDELKAADRQKDRFLAILGHELRNPLACIVNAAELLRGSADSEALQWEVDVIDRQARQLKRLVDDLLNAARIREGTIHIEREPVALERIVAQAVEEVRPAIEARHHELEVDLPAGRVLLDADLARLVQAVANLLSNAARYTEPGGHIRLAAAREGGEVVIRVRDSGAGIPADVLPRLFDMFVRRVGPEDREPEGLGIGLALVRRLVELHGGSVEAHSDGPGTGSEFRIRLPALPDAVPPPKARDEVREERLPPLRILVVDDNQLLAESFVELLRREGCESWAAGNGREALRRARDLRPEVVFLDLDLPDMPGHEVLEHLRRLPGLEQTHFVAVTGYAEEESAERSGRTGFHDHLVKPVELRVVKRLLRDLHRGTRG